MDAEKRAEAAVTEYNQSLKSGSEKFSTTEFCKVIGSAGMKSESERISKLFERDGGI